MDHSSPKPCYSLCRRAGNRNSLLCNGNKYVLILREGEGIEYTIKKEDSTLKPFIKEYTNDEKLQNDVNILKDKGIDKNDVYILSHDDDRTDRIADNAGANEIGLKEMDFSEAVGNLFHKKGDELRTKVQEIGFSKEEAEKFEADMDEGKVLLIVTNNDSVNSYLS